MDRSILGYHSNRKPDLNFLDKSLSERLRMVYQLISDVGDPAGKIVYVNAAATGTGDGTSWENGITDFQIGIGAADSGDSVWVAKGTYQPASGQFFSMKAGVKIYGGFAGTEEKLSQRKLGPDNASILKGSGNTVIQNIDYQLTVDDLIDGFTITGRNTGVGCGMYNDSASPTISNCIFSANTAIDYGGAIRNIFSDPSIINCLFVGNRWITIYNDASHIQLINCTLVGNGTPGTPTIDNYEDSSSNIMNCIIYGNSGGIGSSDGTGSATVTYSLVQDWTDSGIGNLPGNTDPRFQDPSTGNYQLSQCSPCINRGNNSYLPIGDTTDLAGNPRIYGGTVDMGAYEWMIIITQPDDIVVQQGDNATFAVEVAKGINAVYQWQFSSDTRTWINIPGAVQTTLTLEGVSINDNGELYHLLIISTSGNVISNAGRLTVTD